MPLIEYAANAIISAGQAVAEYPYAAAGFLTIALGLCGIVIIVSEMR